MNTAFAIMLISTIVALGVCIPVEVAIWRSSNWKFKLAGVLFQAVILFILVSSIFEVCDFTITNSLNEFYHIFN